MIINKVNISKLSSLDNFAKNLSAKITIPSVILLSGTLGTGKTTFVKYFINNLLGTYDIDVDSPTFNILQIYDRSNITIYHYDFYRVSDENELINLDLEYALRNTITIIEWPDIARNFINSIVKHEDQIDLHLFFDGKDRFIQQI